MIHGFERWQIVAVVVIVAYALLCASLRWRYRRRGCAGLDAHEKLTTNKRSEQDPR